MMKQLGPLRLSWADTTEVLPDMRYWGASIGRFSIGYWGGTFNARGALEAKREQPPMEVVREVVTGCKPEVTVTEDGSVLVEWQTHTVRPDAPMPYRVGVCFESEKGCPPSWFVVGQNVHASGLIENIRTDGDDDVELG